MMRIGALLRRRSIADLGAWHERSGWALQMEGLKPHDPQVAPHLLGEMGLDPALVDAGTADPPTGDEVIAGHQRMVDASGYGVPGLLFPEGQCLFGPVLIDLPIGEAVRLWGAADARIEFPHLYELQRPKTPADEEAIIETLRPHLQARDRGAINRGEVVRFADPDPDPNPDPNPDPDADADTGAAVGGQGR